jgi:magnesium-protoporphyrin O-methyltransferase
MTGMLASTTSWTARRGALEAYFDRTAHDAWAALTSDAKVSRVRATVRAGRERMRDLLLSWLPTDLRGARLLDAGCGTGALALAAAARGAEVVAVDISPRLVQLAAERAAGQPGAQRIRWVPGDMLDPALGAFDMAVAMDSLIHYAPDDMAAATAALARRASLGALVTFAPATPLLRAMHAAGRLFPRGDRSPAIVPVARDRLVARLAAMGLRPGRDERVASGFYTSHALEVAA